MLELEGGGRGRGWGEPSSSEQWEVLEGVWHSLKFVSSSSELDRLGSWEEQQLGEAGETPEQWAGRQREKSGS